MDHRAIRRKQQVQTIQRQQVARNCPDAVVIAGKRKLMSVNENPQIDIGVLMKERDEMTPQETGRPSDGNNFLP